MKVTVDYEGFLRQIDRRGTAGFFESTIYSRIEDDKSNESKRSMFLRITAVATTADGGGILLECVEHCGLDYNNNYAGTERAHELHKELTALCSSRGLTLLNGRIEAH